MLIDFSFQLLLLHHEWMSYPALIIEFVSYCPVNGTNLRPWLNFASAKRLSQQREFYQCTQVLTIISCFSLLYFWQLKFQVIKLPVGLLGPFNYYWSRWNSSQCRVLFTIDFKDMWLTEACSIESLSGVS